jgi:hypothetical protein
MIGEQKKKFVILDDRRDAQTCRDESRELQHNACCDTTLVHQTIFKFSHGGKCFAHTPELCVFACVCLQIYAQVIHIHTHMPKRTHEHACMHAHNVVGTCVYMHACIPGSHGCLGQAGTRYQGTRGFRASTRFRTLRRCPNVCTCHAMVVRTSVSVWCHSCVWIHQQTVLLVLCARSIGSIGNFSMCFSGMFVSYGGVYNYWFWFCVCGFVRMCVHDEVLVMLSVA